MINAVYWHSRGSHTLELASTVFQMLETQEKKVNDIENIVVSKGPGSFSALRVGMGFAKGLSESLGIPVVGISTLEVEAARYFDAIHRPLCPLLEVGRNRIAWSLYEHKSNAWSLSLPEQVSPLEDMVKSVPSRTFFCGEGAWNTLHELNQIAPKSVEIQAHSPPTRKLEILSKLGLVALSSGKGDDSTNMVPNYLRSPSITMPSRTGQTERLGQKRNDNRR